MEFSGRMLVQHVPKPITSITTTINKIKCVHIHIHNKMYLDFVKLSLENL